MWFHINIKHQKIRKLWLGAEAPSHNLRKVLYTCVYNDCTLACTMTVHLRVQGLCTCVHVVKFNRPVSASQLKRLLALHLTSIKRLVLPWPQESTHLEVGFLLRCFQQLSVPHIATQRFPLARELAY